MKQLLQATVFLFFVATTGLLAQTYPGCDGERYRSDVFSEVTATTDIQFGEGVTIAGNTQQLFMDVYEPTGDVQDARPVVMLAFGGSFITGERQDLEPLCIAYARQGYVAVTIDYRLYDLPLIPFPTADEMREVVVKALSDYKAAIRFMREDAATDNQFRCDPEQIFIGGVSAGAIAAAHTAVMQDTDDIDEFLLGLIEDNGGFEGNSSANFEYSSEVQGFISMSGALNDASWIDENDPPFVSIHEDMDITVPYRSGFAQVLGVNIVYLEGGREMQLRADTVGVTNELRTIANSFEHVGYLDTPEEFSSSINFTTSFVHDQICGELVNVQDITPELQAVQVFPNPAVERIQIRNPESLPLHLRLLDNTGRTLQEAINTNELSVTAQPAGLYYLEVIDLRNQQRNVLEVVIQ